LLLPEAKASSATIVASKYMYRFLCESIYSHAIERKKIDCLWTATFRLAWLQIKATFRLE